MKHAQKVTLKNPRNQLVKDQARRLTDYLHTQDLTVTRTQSLEAIAHAVHGKPWNVVKTLELPEAAATRDARITEASKKVAGRECAETGSMLVLSATAPALTVDELMNITQAGRYSLDVAVRIEVWDLIGGDIEAINDRVSDAITGSTIGLESIEFYRCDVSDARQFTSSDSDIFLRVVANWNIDSFGDEDQLENYLHVRFAWVYPDESHDGCGATVNLSTGEVLFEADTPWNIREPLVRVRLEEQYGEPKSVDALFYDTPAECWRVHSTGLTELKSWQS